MPKIIPHLRENILSVGRELLIDKGYCGFNIRDISELCHIAMGTLYNYFSCKGDLVAEIMETDWLKRLHSKQDAFSPENSEIDRAETLFHLIRSFRAEYEKIWTDLNISEHVKDSYKPRFADIMDEVYSFTGLSRFIVDIITHFSMRPEYSFEEIRPELIKFFR